MSVNFFHFVIWCNRLNTKILKVFLTDANEITQLSSATKLNEDLPNGFSYLFWKTNLFQIKLIIKILHNKIHYLNSRPCI